MYASIERTIVYLNLKQNDKRGKTCIKKVSASTADAPMRRKKERNKTKNSKKTPRCDIGVFFCLCYNLRVKKSKTKKRVGIIRGGKGKNYEASLRQGGELISHIFENLSERWKVVDILIDKDGIWHANGIPISPADLTQKVELIWNTAHHSLANVLQGFSIPTINISSFSFLLQQESEVLRDHLKELDLKMPRKIVFPLYQEDFDGPVDLYVARKAREVLGKFSAPWIVKTFTEDVDMGIHLAKTFPELVTALQDGIRHQKSILVEEFIYGRNISLHSVGGFRGKGVYVFPPENLLKEEKEKFIQMAKDLHRHLGAEHYLNSNFVLHPKRGIFVTDVSLLPDLQPGSHLEKACDSVGAKVHHLVEHILEKTLS